MSQANESSFSGLIFENCIHFIDIILVFVLPIQLLQFLFGLCTVALIFIIIFIPTGNLSPSAG